MQIFFLQARFVFGPDVRSLALTICLIAVPVTIFCIFVARKLMDDFSDSWGVSIVAVAVVFTIYVSISFSSLCVAYVLMTEAMVSFRFVSTGFNSSAGYIRKRSRNHPEKRSSSRA